MSKLNTGPETFKTLDTDIRITKEFDDRAFPTSRLSSIPIETSKLHISRKKSVSWEKNYREILTNI